jgi:hypothetical protein
VGRRNWRNQSAIKTSDTWARWSRDFAWAERASAYDVYIESLRREACERVIVEEAARQAREVERTRYRLNELLTVAHHRAMEVLEDDFWVRDNLRASDVIRIIVGHVDYLKTFDTEPESRDVDDWEEDDAAIEQIIKEVDALADLEGPEDEERSGEGSGEDDSEESEDGHN